MLAQTGRWRANRHEAPRIPLFICVRLRGTLTGPVPRSTKRENAELWAKEANRMRRLIRGLIAALPIVPLGLVAAVAAAPAAQAEDNGVGKRRRSAGAAGASCGLARTHRRSRERPGRWSARAWPRPVTATSISTTAGTSARGRQGPNVDGNRPVGHEHRQLPGRRHRRTASRPWPTYVHSLGLKFGLYVTPGSRARRWRRTPRSWAPPYTADQIATTAAEQLQLRRHAEASTTASRARRRTSTPGRRRVRVLGRGLRQARRGRVVRHPGRGGLVRGAAAGRPPDGPGAVQQPGHLRRHHLVADWPTAGAPPATSSATAARAAAATR